METKQSARELLKEAQSAIMEALKMIGSKRQMGGACGQTVGAEGYQIRGTGWYFGEVEEPLSNAWHDIDAYLSAPSESALDEKWGPSTIDKIRQRNADGDFTLDYWRATELIEDYGRRVPREFVEEILDEAWNCLTDRLGGNVLQKIAAKYGVKVEG